MALLKNKLSCNSYYLKFVSGGNTDKADLFYVEK